jgi:hypothetical protein
MRDPTTSINFVVTWEGAHGCQNTVSLLVIQGSALGSPLQERASVDQLTVSISKKAYTSKTFEKLYQHGSEVGMRAPSALIEALRSNSAIGVSLGDKSQVFHANGFDIAAKRADVFCKRNNP